MMRTLAMSVLLMICAFAMAQTPQETGFTYQGRLSQAGTPAQGNVDMTFSLYDAPVGGNQIGATLLFTAANGNPVAVDGGVFDVTLDFGSLAFITPITDQRFLAVTVNGTVLTPRTPIENAPYALQSRTSEFAYGVSDGSIGTAQINAAQVQRRVGGTCASGSSVQSVNADGSVACQSVGSGTISAVIAGSGLIGGGTTGSVTLSADTTIVQKRVTGTCASGSAMNTIAADGTVTCQSGSSGDITGVLAGNGLSGGGTSGDVTLNIANPLNVSGTDANGVIVAQNTAGNAVAIQGRSDAGVGLFGKTISGRGVEGDAAAANGSGVIGINSSSTGIAYGVRGQTASASGLAVAGYANSASGANAGVLGATNSGAGVGVRGSAMDSIGANLGGGVGVYGETASGNGVYGSASDSGGIGVFGNGETGIVGLSSTGAGAVGQSTSSNGVSGISQSGIGVRGTSTSSDGVRGTSTSSRGVFGLGIPGVQGVSSDPQAYGVYGYNSATSGFPRGVYGEAAAAGVHGFSTGGEGIYGETVNGLAIYGYASGSGKAGYFQGNVQVTGTLSKAAGSFQIDHPLDPANKYLYHSFVESPDMKNIYDGIATLDARGEAWVEMPTYFEALNRDFRYQLTALDAPAPSLHVAARIADNRFRLAGGQAGQQVSWQVTGTRKDAYAEAHRIVPEVDKPAGERGKYLHPTLFGESESKTAVVVPRTTPPQPEQP